MNILLTNDDGIYAEGINALYNELKKNHNVFVFAPHEEKSGCSSAITFKEKVKIENISNNQFAVHGFTVDCVDIGLKGNIISEVDLVVSGINHGANLGDDVYFSGTVAGARLAFIYGISGIAISLDCSGTSQYFNEASRFLADFLENNKILKGITHILLNINYPDLPKDEILGVKYSFLGKRKYRNSYLILHKAKKEMNLQLNRGIEVVESEGSDITDIKRGYISIVPLTLDCTDYEYLEKLKHSNL